MYMREGCKRRLAQKLQVEKMTTNRKQIRPTQPYPVWTLIFSETSEILVIRSSITNHTICAHVFLGRQKVEATIAASNKMMQEDSKHGNRMVARQRRGGND